VTKHVDAGMFSQAQAMTTEKVASVNAHTCGLDALVAGRGGGRDQF
jgi:hypothetical protein